VDVVRNGVINLLKDSGKGCYYVLSVGRLSCPIFVHLSGSSPNTAKKLVWGQQVDGKVLAQLMITYEWSDW
jgi:hypothetical protein